MIGKANEIRTIQAVGGRRSDSTVEAGFRWVPIDEAINEKLEQIGDAEVVLIQMSPRDITPEVTALIIYRIKN